MAKASLVIAEDMNGIRCSLEDGFGMRGYDVHAFPDGKQALNYLLAPTTPPQFLITDLGMPILDGYGLLNGIANLYSIPTIIYSSDDPDLAKIAYSGKIIVCPKTKFGTVDLLESVVCQELGLEKFVFPPCT